MIELPKYDELQPRLRELLETYGETFGLDQMSSKMAGLEYYMIVKNFLGEDLGNHESS